MAILDFLNPINTITEIIKKAVPDKDLRAKLTAQLETLREQSYQAELAAQTIPWVDALHKMGRQILSYFSIAVCAWLIYEGKADAGMLLALVTPAGVYNGIKGKGR